MLQNPAAEARREWRGDLLVGTFAVERRVRFMHCIDIQALLF